MDVRLPDGTIISNVPDNMTRAELTERLSRNGYDVSSWGAAPKEPVAVSTGRAINSIPRQLGLTARYAMEGPAEAAQIVTEPVAGLMRITITRFWRDHRTFSVLGERILPALLDAVDGSLIALSAGVASGEEAASLLLSCRSSPKDDVSRLRVVALEIDADCLARARRAVYPASALRALPAATRTRRRAST